ncbi:MAG: serine hydrolase domain-containing protein [Planctomycetaceae bacterium]
MTEHRLSRRAATRRIAAAAAALAVTSSDGTTQLMADTPLSVTGTHDDRLKPFDDLMTRFVSQEQVPGAALAVTRGERLVYARGFGRANTLNDETVQPHSRFRIASISKPITAVAILRLVEQEQLSLSAHVTRLLSLEECDDPRWHEVTVRQLLQHTGGWDREVSFDPMFRSTDIAEEFGAAPPAGPDLIIPYMQQRSLDFAPGSRYAYSNFGYCLLGRVIEQITGLSYEAAVRREVFEPLGITDPVLGRTLKKAEREVRYYTEDDATGPSVFPPVGRPVPLPYGAWNLEAMDSHGGWVSRAIDLVRFASALGAGQSSPLLSEASMTTMIAPPEGPPPLDESGQRKAVWYGCGWNVRNAGEQGGVNLWHQGALAGTSTILVRRHDGLCWAVLFNRRTGTDAKNLASLIDSSVHLAADAVSEWPSHDLFDTLLHPPSAE